MERKPQTPSAVTGRDTVVETDALTKSYGRTRVVDGVSLHVERGEIFGILGTNGAGKTTSVECIQGLRRPDSGRLRVLGHDPIKGRSHLAGRVGSQLQDSSLPERLRVGEAIRLFAETRDQVRRAMADWHLDAIAKVPFAGLSGGQRQRLFLALALLNDPEVVFLDELTQGLDPTARRQVWALIERVRDHGTTVVLVTHFMEEAEVLCDRVAVMASGRVIDQGSPAELIERHSVGVRVRFPAPPAALGWVQTVPGVSGASIHGRDIEACGPSTMIAHLGAALVHHGHDATPMRIHQPGLEDALISLIGDRKIVDPNKAAT